MPTPTRHLALVAFLATILSACSVVGTGPLATVTTRGGECVDGPCGSVIVIERDGSVHSAEKPPNDLGTIPPDLLAALDAAIRTTDFDAVRAVPFEDECPTAYDGQEVIYEFGTPAGVERVASCETSIDPAHPAFAATTAALVAVDVVPAP